MITLGKGKPGLRLDLSNDFRFDLFWTLTTATLLGLGFTNEEWHKFGEVGVIIW